MPCCSYENCEIVSCLIIFIRMVLEFKNHRFFRVGFLKSAQGIFSWIFYGI